jgi:hypothetical protein
MRPESTYMIFTFTLIFHLPLQFQNDIFFSKVALLRLREANESYKKNMICIELRNFQSHFRNCKFYQQLQS